MDSTQAQIMLASAYDVAFQIYHHDPNISENPLDLVAYHAAEDYHQYSGIYRAIDRFHRLEIASRFGLSLYDYLQLPHDYISMVNEIALKKTQQEQEIQKQVEQEQESGKGKQTPRDAHERGQLSEREIFRAYGRRC